jgi:hypothetical protein
MKEITYAESKSHNKLKTSVNNLFEVCKTPNKNPMKPNELPSRSCFEKKSSIVYT